MDLNQHSDTVMECITLLLMAFLCYNTTKFFQMEDFVTLGAPDAKH